MIRIKSKRCVWALAGLTSVLLPGSVLRAEGEAPEPRPQFQVFEERLAEVAAAVEEGLLSAETASAAANLAFELKREMIRRDAEIDVLRLEIANFEDEAQQQALDRLVAAVTARESSVIERIRRLERLAGTSQCADSSPGAESPPVTASEPPDDSKDGERKLDLKIGFEAQDLTEDPDP